MIVNILTVTWLHFIGDFLLQTDSIALKKSESNFVLLTHCCIYSFCLLYFGWKFALINCILHFVVDWCTSRANKKLYQTNRHWFFTMIGFDQAIHMTVLVITLHYFGCPIF